MSVSFDGQSERTSVAFGPNPSWNEQIELDWEKGNSQLVAGFKSMDKEEFLFINIFDEKVTIEVDGEQTRRGFKIGKFLKLFCYVFF